MNPKRIIIILVLFLPGTLAVAQTINTLPQMIVTPFADISAEAKEKTIGETVMTMFRTALDKSLVFNVPSIVGMNDFSLPVMKRTFTPPGPRKAYLVEGYSSLFDNEIQTDVRIYDIYTEKLAAAFYIKVDSILNLRDKVNTSVREVEQTLFRDTLSSLRLKISQGEGDIYLDGKYMGTSSTDGSLSLTNVYPGEYKLKVLAQGYMDYEETILIRPRHISNITVALSLEPGILVLDSSPQGAEILINGRAAGVTPRKFDQFDPGEYSIELSLENYKNWKEKLSVESRQEKKINAVMEINPGSVVIRTDPPGISVYREGIFVGESPLHLPNLVPGKYIFELNLAGFIPYDLAVNVDHGKESSYDIKMEREMGLMSFHSTPPGAAVQAEDIEGNILELGFTPLAKQKLPVGHYTITLDKEGFSPQTQEIYCNKEEQGFLELELSPLPGSIRVETEPQQANIYLDGRYRGITPLEISGLPPGSYKVTASTAFGSETREITVIPDEVSRLSLSIKKNSSSFISGILITAISVAAYLSVVN